MSLKRPRLSVQEKKENLPILIVDEENVIGEALAAALVAQAPVVFVSKRCSLQNKHLMFLSFRNTLPSLPQYSYAALFVVYHEGLDGVFPQFVDKAKKDNAPLVVVVHKNHASKKLLETLLFYGSHVRLVIIGDPLGQDSVFTDSFETHRILMQAEKTRRIILFDHGTYEVFPVGIDDIVQGLVTVAFGKYAKRVFFLYPPHPPTALSFVRALHKVDPDLRIAFSPASLAFPPMFSGGVTLLSQSYPWQSLVQGVYTNLPARAGHRYVISPKKRSSTPVKRVAVLGARGVLILFFLPFFITVLVGGVGVLQLLLAKNSLGSGNLAQVGMFASYAHMSFRIAQKTASVTVVQAALLGQKDATRILYQNISDGKDIALIAQDLSHALISYQAIFLGESKTPREDFIRASQEVKRSLITLQKLKADTQKESLLAAPIVRALTAYDPQLALATSVIDVLPTLLGFDGQKSYLLLFQNNMELRPSGGFIGSYGIAKLQGGRLTHFSVHDVYDADGQLKGHVEPPYVIRRYIPSVHWYLRDSNFSPDFPKSASTAAHFLKLETGELAFGVVGVDVSFLKSLLGVVGPVYVPAYNETVTTDNMYLLTQAHAEKSFFPGSTQKKDFLRALTTALSEKLSKEKSLPYEALIKAVIDAISEKHVLLAVSDPSIQQLFAVNGVSSALLDQRAESESLIRDFLGINEANIGVNKANYYLQRKVMQEVSLDANGTISEQVTISYFNQSKPGAWPGGDYRAYLRIILPLDATLDDITINRQAQTIAQAITDPFIYEARTFVAPTGIEVDRADEFGKTIYGFLVTVPAGKSTTVSVSYRLAKHAPTASPFSYSLRVFKQSGTDPYPFEFVFSPAPVFSIYNISDDLRQQGNRTTLKTVYTQDIDILIDLLRR